jgi:hypothetical protein
METLPTKARLPLVPSFLTRISAPRTLSIAAILVAATISGSALANPASPDDATLSEALLHLGDCGGSIAQQLGEPGEAGAADAILLASGAFSTAGERIGLIAEILLADCDQDGPTACEAAARCSELAAKFSQVAAYLSDGETKLGAELSRGLVAEFGGVFSFGSSDAMPDEIRVHLKDASAALERATRILTVLSDPTGFEAALDPVLAVAAEGTSTMLAQIREFEPVQWPAEYLGVPIVGLDDAPLDWSDGSASAEALEDPASQAALSLWAQLGARGVLERNGGKLLLSELTAFGTNLRDGAYGLRSLLSEGVDEDGWCVLRCQNDTDCGPCHIVATGLGIIEFNPEDFWFWQYVIEASIHVDPAMPVDRELREMIQEALAVLGQYKTGRNTLYLKMEYRYCYKSSCWLAWEESECLAKTTEWIRVPAEDEMRWGPVRQWMDHHWERAARDAEIEARDWCLRQ